ncbi:MAG: MoaD/ThiS family protein [Nitrososphaeria archaeon]|jgi:molybdopterin converting factor small subunit
MKVVFVGHLKNLFGREDIKLDKNFGDISELLVHLSNIREDEKVSINRQNTLFFVNGTEISALENLGTKLKGNDIITLVPITHGG